MKNSLARQTASSGGLLILLLALQHWELQLPNHGAGRVLRDLVGVSRGRDASLALLNGQTAGYYEQLLRGSDQRVQGKKLLDWLRGSPAALRPQAENYIHGGFLLYQQKPNLNCSNSEEGPVRTNRYGLSDSDYATDAPARTRRVALFGDSFTRGWGLPMKDRFEARFESQLNSKVGVETGERFEVLDFGVSGYRITQMYDLALEKAAPFHPNVYMLALTGLTTGPSWGDHLAELVHTGSDLKYDFLREVVRASGIRKDDEGPVMQAKLEAYRLPVFREILTRLNAHAESQSSQLIVALVSAPEDAGLAKRRFSGVRELLRGMGIPVLDVSDAFDQIADVESMRIAWFDLHPNAAGHKLIADNLAQKLYKEPRVWWALTGQPTRTKNGERAQVPLSNDSKPDGMGHSPS